jgi:tRNA 2-thiouridine synthesizing protein A
MAEKAPGMIVDARHLRCPLPALRLAKAVREGGPGRYVLLADDPAAQADVPALCRERGWHLKEAGLMGFTIDVPASGSPRAASP